MKNNKVVIIGSGFSGISVATSLADKGFDVTILEKNNSPGGRARTFSENGFTFDMGPSWYWMPDVFDSYFESFGYKTSDLYELKRLDPSYRVVFGKDDFLDLPASFEELANLFESLEQGSSIMLTKFLSQAAYKYEVGINNLVYKPSRSLLEFFSLRLLYDILRMDVFKSFHKHIRSFFRHERIIRIMEFPILLLGALPQNTPALYSLMNYADIKLGTWYPMGGMYKIIDGMLKVAYAKGVQLKLNEDVMGFEIQENKITQVNTEKGKYDANIIVASADYHHVENALLPKSYRSYSEDYWNSRKMAPSSLLFYIGLNKKLDKLQHHNLFFDEDFAPHAQDIYQNKRWPDKPLFYLSVTSKTDTTVAPEGCENLFFLIPVAPDLKDNEEIREKYYHIVMDRLEKLIGQSVRDAVIYKRTYAHNDFVEDYNAFKGNAYGLANTLMQTAILKPNLKSKKVNNLYYTGQLTVPGPGVPPSLISGKVVAEEIAKEFC
ncbi:phytoene desaturase family protein [Catalinimonas niigatensis]|uniref:phytoene desaturase family protein n=1 Tax=Catalinimonas niigatensis TaxID=1397264 RepID=UPI002665BA20|nr:phytoene desaturase family protein [Catalinimonas niigatensis]WPP51551.1 phytoene desaturase family protein [Catalinimonas niigatensis]